MTLIKLFLVVLFVTLSLATNSEINFSNLDEEIIIGKERLQAYTNDLEEEGTMVLKLILESGKEYNLSSMLCRVGKGQFNWVPPNSIPDNSVGVFEYVISVDGDEFTGTSEKMRFVLTPSSSSDTSSPSTDSSSTSSADTSSSDTSSSDTSSSNTTTRTTTTRTTTKTTERRTTTTAPKSSSTETIDNTLDNTIDTNSQNGNDAAIGMPEQQFNSTPQQPVGQTNDSTTQNNSIQGVDSSSNPENKNYLIYIGGGSGIVVVALTGLFVAYRVKSRRSLSEYEFDSRPYNNTSMEMPALLNGNLTSVNVIGSPNYLDTPKGNQYNNNYNNGPMGYRGPNANNNGYVSPSLSDHSSNLDTTFYNSPRQGANNDAANNSNNSSNKRNTYEMISPYDPRETSYQNYSGNYDDSLVLDNNNGIINLNSNPNTNLNVDINSKVPSSENYSANPRCGSLPRNRVPEDIAVPLMSDEEDEETRRNYRSSILSYISSNRGSFYGDASAEHSISHILLNQVCTVAYASQPENEDELYLCVGDKVKILEVYDDGWAYSLHISSGLEGMIPLNCTAEYYQ